MWAEMWAHVCMCVCVRHVSYLVDRTRQHRGVVETLSSSRMCLCMSSSHPMLRDLELTLCTCHIMLCNVMLCYVHKAEL